MKKRIIALFTAAVLFFSVFFVLPASAETEKPELTHIRAALLYNATADELMYDLNGEATLFPASFVKIMTAVLSLEYYADKPEAKVQIPYEAVEGAKDSASADLFLGEIVPARDLIAAMIVANANDAAIALACDIAGSERDFVTLMNGRAEKLGMTGTHYENATGLHSSKMVTTANDTLLLVREAYRTDGFLTFASMASYTMPVTNFSMERHLANRNYLVSRETVSRYYDGDASGMNYGSTYEAGGCLAATVTSGGSRYFAVIMGADNMNDPETGILQMYAYIDALALFDWARNNYSYTCAVSSSGIIAEIPVAFGNNADYVALLPAEDIYVFMKNGEEDLVSVTWDFDQEKLTAPVAVGQRAGTLTVTYGEKIYTTDLVARSTVDLSVWSYWAGEAAAFFRSDLFRRILTVLLAVSVLYIICSAIWRGRMRRKSLERSRAKEEAERIQREKQTIVVHRVSGEAKPAARRHVPGKKAAPAVTGTNKTGGKAGAGAAPPRENGSGEKPVSRRRPAPYIDAEPVLREAGTEETGQVSLTAGKNGRIN